MSQDPQVSVVTPVHRSSAAFLPEAYESLQQSSTRWEWVLQLDGVSEPIPSKIAADDRVSVAANERDLGIAITRNRALSRARAPFVKPLDADDRLPTGSLEAALEALQAHPDAAFLCGRSRRIGPDGLVSNDEAPLLEEGIIEIGRLEELWREHGQSPIRYGTIMWRRDILQAFGGWAALSEMEDVSLTLAVNLSHRGLFIDDELLISRDHAGQASISDDCIRDRPLNRVLIHQRLLALRKLLGLSIPSGFEKPPPDVSTQRAMAKAQRLRNQ